MIQPSPPLTSAPERHYQISAVDKQSAVVIPQSTLLARIQQSVDLVEMYEMLQKKILAAAPCSFSVSWVSLSSLIDSIPPEVDEKQRAYFKKFLQTFHLFDAIHFKAQPTDSVDISIQFDTTKSVENDTKPSSVDNEKNDEFVNVTIQFKENNLEVKKFSIELLSLLNKFMQLLEVDCVQIDPATIRNPAGLPECGANIFFTPVYEHYRNQLREFVTAQCAELDPQNKNGVLLDILNNLSSADPKHLPDMHESLHNLWRLLLKPHVNGSELDKKLSSALTMWLYSQCDLTEGWWQHLLNLTDPSLAAPTDLFKALDEFSTRLRTNPRLKGALHHTKTDLLAAGDLPSFLWSFEHKDGKVTRFIRTSSVIYSAPKDEVQTIRQKLIPEFDHLLNTLEGLNLTYSYFDLRAREDENYFRKKLIQASRFRPSFQVNRLDRNSDRYEQINQFSQASANALVWTDIFKKRQLIHFREDPLESNCLWSRPEEKETWVKMYDKICQQVHAHYFGGSVKLNDEERGDFNEIKLLYLSHHKICLEKPWMASCSCYLSVDRGPSFYTLLYLLHCLINGIPIRTPQIKKALAMLFGPGVSVDNRLMHQERIQRFERVARRLLSRPPLTL